MSENDLEPLAEVEGARGGVGVDWEMVSKEAVTTPGRVGLNELERLADTVGNGGGVIVGWEMVIGLVTVALDELEQLARKVDVRSKVMSLVIIRGTVTVETLPVNVSTTTTEVVVRVLDTTGRHGIDRCREEDYLEKQVEVKKANGERKREMLYMVK